MNPLSTQVDGSFDYLSTRPLTGQRTLVQNLDGDDPDGEGGLFHFNIEYTDAPTGGHIVIHVVGADGTHDVTVQFDDNDLNAAAEAAFPDGAVDGTGMGTALSTGVVLAIQLNQGFGVLPLDLDATTMTNLLTGGTPDVPEFTVGATEPGYEPIEGHPGDKLLDDDGSGKYYVKATDGWKHLYPAEQA